MAKAMDIGTKGPTAETAIQPENNPLNLICGCRGNSLSSHL
jgi:hypothetical protein